MTGSASRTEEAERPIELAVSLFVPPSNPAFGLLAEFASEIRERSQGRLALTLHPSEQLGRTAEQYDLARTGAADIACVMHAVTPGRFPLTELAGLPFLMPDALAGTAALNHILPGHLAEEHVGVKVLFLAANVPMAVHATTPLRTKADFAGKRIRCPGNVVAATMAALGARPVNVMPLDVPQALHSGEIDGAVMTYEGALVNRLADVVSHSTNLNANTVTFALVMNPQRYEALPHDLQAVVSDVLGVEAGMRFAGRLSATAEEGRTYMEENGVCIVDLSPAELEAIRAAVDPAVPAMIAQLSAAGLPAEEVHAVLVAELGRAGP